MSFQNVRFILMDIEGTTTDIHFVKNVLFPYSARELRNYVASHRTQPAVRECLKNTGAGSDEAALAQLLQWIRDDVKHPALKTLQGMIWAEGYASGAYKSHIYDDVVTAWQKWAAQGLRLGIYSSGSAPAQKLLFQYTEKGDLRGHLTAYFDLDVGGKREASSYRKIAQQLELPAPEILFLSDIPEEIRAAQTADFQVAHIVRPGTSSAPDLRSYASFLELSVHAPT